jgi:hypothetical protein
MISDWQQLNLEEAIKKIDIQKNSLSSAEWFNSRNPTTIQFCVKMTSSLQPV